MKRMIKRVISLVLTALIFSAGAYGAELKTPLSPEGLEPGTRRAIDAVSALDLLWEGFNPHSGTTRLELAQLLYRLYFRGNPQQGYEGDVPELADYGKEEQFAAAVYAMVELDILQTGTGNHFEPERYATYLEVLRGLELVLGYGKLFDTDDPDLILQEAYKRKLTEQVLIKSYDDSIKDEYTAVLLYNALEAEIVTWSADGAQAAFTVGDHTLLEALGYERGDAQVRSVPGNALFGAQTTAEGFIQLGNEVLETNGEGYAGLLGYRVRYYKKTGKQQRNDRLVYAEPYRTETAEVTGADIIKEKTTLTSLVYYDGEKQKTAKISQTADVIYNGKTMFDYRVSHIAPENGSVKLLDIDGDRTYDVVISEGYRNVVVKDVGKQGLFVTDYYSSEKTSFDPKDYETIALYKNGQACGFDLIKKWDVLSIFESEGPKTEKMIRVYVSDRQVSGRITAVTKNEAGRTCVSIDNQPYELASGYEGAAAAGEEGIFVLDWNGKIAVRIDQISTAEKLGMLLNAYCDPGDDRWYVKVFLEDNTWAVYRLTANAQLNGSPVAGGDLPGYCGQPVTFRVKADGEVSRIDTGADGSYEGDSSRLRLVLDNQLRRFSSYSNGFSAESRYIDTYVDSDTVVFCVENGAVQDHTKYSAIRSDIFLNGLSYTISVYQRSQGQAADVIVYRTTAADVNTTQGLCIVEETFLKMNTSDEVVAAVRLWCNNSISEFEGKDADSFDGLKKGDILQYKSDASGKTILGYTKYFSLENQPPRKQGTTAASPAAIVNITNDFVSVFGAVIEKNDIYLTLDLPENPDPVPKRLTYDVSKAKVYCIDTKEEEISVISLGDIEPGQDAFLRCNRTQVLDIVVIK